MVHLYESAKRWDSLDAPRPNMIQHITLLLVKSGNTQMNGKGLDYRTKPQIIEIDLMHDDVTRHEGSMGVVVTLKSKMAASSASSGGNSKTIVSFDLSENSNKSPSRLLDGPATSGHM